MFSKEKSFLYLGKIVVMSIGMDLPPNQIKLASCTRPVLFDFHGHMMEVVVLEIKNKIL